MAVTSEPACGSEIAIAVTTPPFAMIGRYFFRCSSEPKCSSGMMNMELRPAIEAQAGETLEISSRAMQTIVRLPFGPPYCFGHPELHQAHFAEQFDDFEREAVGFVDFGGNRRDVPGNHLSDAVAEGRSALR